MGFKVAPRRSWFEWHPHTRPKHQTSKCVNVSLYTSARLAARSVMPAGNSIVLSMEFSLMAICHLIRLLEMTPFQPFSQRLDQENMFLELYLLILSQRSLMKQDVAPIDSFSTRNS